MPRRNASHRALTIAIVLLVVCLANVATAGEDREKMLELTGEAAELFQAQKYEEAALKFSAAYDAFPDPNLKKNEMVAWFKAENCGHALPAGETFLQEGKDITESDRSDVRTVRVRCDIKTARAKLDLGELDAAEDALERAIAANPGDEDRKTIGELQAEIDRRRAEIEPPPPPPDDPPDEPARPVWMPVTGGVALGLSLVGWTYFTYSQIAAVPVKRDLETEGGDCTNTGGGVVDEDPSDDYDCDAAFANFEFARKTQWPNAIVSGTLTIVGLGLLYYYFFVLPDGTEAEEEEPPVTIAPTLGADGGGVILRWRF